MSMFYEIGILLQGPLSLIREDAEKLKDLPEGFRFVKAKDLGQYKEYGDLVAYIKTDRHLEGKDTVMRVIGGFLEEMDTEAAIIELPIEEKK